MLTYQSVFTETLFTTLLFLCNYVKAAQLMKDRKGKTCMHKLRRRWQWSKISQANNLESKWTALVCVEATLGVFCAVHQEWVSQDPWAGCVCSQLFFAILLLCSFWPCVPGKQGKLLASKNHYQCWQMPTKDSFPYAQRFTFTFFSCLHAACN